jgi:nucleotide-binding universal stress UspA family protein
MRVPPKSILVPTDFSESAAAALEYAVTLAEKVGATITLLHSYEIPIVGFPDGALVPTADIAARITNAAQDGLDATVAKYKGLGIELRPMLETGDAREVIPAIAEKVDADLIVMGTHGRRGLSRALLGSVAEAVVRTATRPVLTLRVPKQAQARAGQETAWLVG